MHYPRVSVEYFAYFEYFAYSEYFAYFAYFAYLAYFYCLVICRLKKDRKTFKDVPLFGIGMLHMIDQIFWNLPFASPKQATVVREKCNIPEEDWQAKRTQLEEEHKADGARDQLRNGWKQWLGAAGPQAEQPARVAPASLETPVFNDA